MGLASTPLQMAMRWYAALEFEPVNLGLGTWMFALLFFAAQHCRHGSRTRSCCASIDVTSVCVTVHCELRTGRRRWASLAWPSGVPRSARKAEGGKHDAQGFLVVLKGTRSCKLASLRKGAHGARGPGAGNMSALKAVKSAGFASTMARARARARSCDGLAVAAASLAVAALGLVAGAASHQHQHQHQQQGKAAMAMATSVASVTINVEQHVAETSPEFVSFNIDAAGQHTHTRTHAHTRTPPRHNARVERG